MRADADKLAALEDEGGRTGGVSVEVPRILIVDNDMRSADSLELMLSAAGIQRTPPWPSQSSSVRMLRFSR